MFDTMIKAARTILAMAIGVVWICGGAAARAQPASLSLANRAYAAIPASSDFAVQQFTLSVWLKPTGPGENGGGTLVSKSGRPDLGNLLCSWWMGWSSSSGKVLGLVVHEYATSGRSITSNATVALGQTAHAALTFDGVTLRLYINGVLDREEAYGFNGVYYSNEDVMIGAFNANSGYTFNRFQGNLDDISIWGRALGAGEIAALAACESWVSTNALIAYLPFTGQQLTDASGHGHSAAAVGAIGFGASIAAVHGAPVVTSQPSSQTVCPTGAASFTVAGDGGPFSYRWQWQPAGAGTPWVDLVEGVNAEAGGTPVVNATGTHAGTLQARPIIGYINFPPRAFRCVVTNPCGGVTSDAAMLVVCPADFDCDGTADFFDYDAFVTCFEGGACPPGATADFDGDGSVDFFDYDAFVVAFETAC